MEVNNLHEERNIIQYIELGSIGEELEIEPGDILLKINDSIVKDIIDYKYLVADDFIVLEIQKPNGDIWEFEIEKDYDEDLGIIFTNPLIDRAKSCTNKCIFCFVDQLPRDMRDTLYFKDDDSRLSFLQGNFITLTNMSDEEIDRIIRYRLSPINISVHTTNPDLRVEMLNNKRAGRVYDILKRFHQAKLEVNCQIVLVPGVNDGIELKNTIKDLSDLYPTIKSVAVVPVGVTKYRQGLYNIVPFDSESSKELLDQVKIMQKEYLENLGTRFVFASDEFFALSREKVLDLDEYEGFPQLENGVGLMKSLESEIEEELKRISIKSPINKKYIMVTGTLAYDFIQRMAEKITTKFHGLEIKVIPIINSFFGDTITVSGLITGQDLVNTLMKYEYKDYNGIIIPESMLKRDEEVLLDNMTLDDIEEKLNCEVIVSKVNGKELLDIIRR